MRSRRSGFTLIELLVVIAIIAILAAILIPLFAAARNKAKFAACASHAKELTGAFLMYAGDWDDHLCGHNAFNGSLRGYAPEPAPDDDPSTGALWKYYKSRKLLRCPADKERLNKPGGDNFSSYTMNSYCTWRYQSRDPLYAGNDPDKCGPPLSLYPRHSRAILLVEENVFGDSFSVCDTSFIYRDYVTERHFGRGVVTFLDGHVSTVKGGAAGSTWRTATWPDGSYMFHDGKWVN